MELKGKSAIVTGSTGALGSELVKALAEAGCNCICHYYKNKEKADKLVSDIKSMSQQAIAIQADLTEPEQVDALFDEALNNHCSGQALNNHCSGQALNNYCSGQASRYAPLQILINSASVFERTPLQELSVGQARHVLDLNLTACLLTAKAFAQRISKASEDKDAPTGKIINIIDVAATKPWAGYSLYCASKAGLIGATKALAKELAPNISVNALAPGIATWPVEMTEEEEKRQLGFIPMRRFAETKEIAAAMMFLLENDYITGQVLNVCGGRGI